MGGFGIGHQDTMDSAAHYTCMTALSDIPHNYDPGYFHLIGLGVYVKLIDFLSMLFCGLYQHGGSAPTCPPGEDPVEWAIRYINVFYPPTKMVHGVGSLVFGALPRGRELLLPPEITHVGYVIEA